MKNKDEVSSVKETFDKCMICHWKGPSEKVVDNKCPICGCEDLIDSEFKPYEDPAEAGEDDDLSTTV